MMRLNLRGRVEPWLARAKSGLAASFPNGVIKNNLAASAAISSSWSNGQTEGPITKLKSSKARCTGAVRSTSSTQRDGLAIKIASEPRLGAETKDDIMRIQGVKVLRLP
jgi:hypothetical protein